MSRPKTTRAPVSIRTAHTHRERSGQPCACNGPMAAATPNGDVAAAIGPLHAQGWPERSLWVCAVRMDTGARVVFGRDIDAPPASVAEAVTASCAIPAYFAPPVIDGVRYVDGGVRSLCNLDLMAGLGLDLVLVSAPMSSSAWVEPRRAVALRTWARAQLEREARRVRASGTPVLLLHPGAAARAAAPGCRRSTGVPLARTRRASRSSCARAHVRKATSRRGSTQALLDMGALTITRSSPSPAIRSRLHSDRTPPSTYRTPSMTGGAK